MPDPLATKKKVIIAGVYHHLKYYSLQFMKTGAELEYWLHACLHCSEDQTRTMVLGHQAQLLHVSCLLMQLAYLTVALWAASFLHLQACWTVV